MGHGIDLWYRGIWANVNEYLCPDIILTGIENMEGQEESWYHTVLTREPSHSSFHSISIPLLTSYLNIWRIVTSHPSWLSSMFTVGLNFVKITLFNTITLTALLIPGPSALVGEMCLCEAKLTSCCSCEATHHIPPWILTCFKLQKLLLIFNDHELIFYPGYRRQFFIVLYNCLPWNHWNDDPHYSHSYHVDTCTIPEQIFVVCPPIDGCGGLLFWTYLTTQVLY